MNPTLSCWISNTVCVSYRGTRAELAAEIVRQYPNIAPAQAAAFAAFSFYSGF